MIKNYLVFLVISLLPTGVHGQHDSDSVFNPTIFRYHEYESVYAIDFGGTVGFGTGSIQYGLVVNLDVYHILLGYNYTASIPIKEKVTQNSFLLGYRWRNNRFMVAAATGIAFQKFKCTSGTNYNCYQYDEGSETALPLNFQADLILSDNFALGLTLQNSISQRTSVSGLLFTMKFGAFREY